jgi:hypothetical protein
MSLGQQETVAVWPVRALGVVAHYVKVKRDNEVCAREAAARVSRCGIREHFDDIFSNVFGDGFKAGEHLSFRGHIIVLRIHQNLLT